MPGTAMPQAAMPEPERKAFVAALENSSRAHSDGGPAVERPDPVA